MYSAPPVNHQRKSLVKNRNNSHSSGQPAPEQQQRHSVASSHPQQLPQQQQQQQSPIHDGHLQDDGTNTQPMPMLMSTQPYQAAQIQATHAQILGQQQLLQHQPQQQNLQQQQLPSGQMAQQGPQQQLPVYSLQTPGVYPVSRQGQPNQQQPQQAYGQPNPNQMLPAMSGGQPQYGLTSPGGPPNPMFSPQTTGTVQMETKNVTTTSITSVPLTPEQPVPQRLLAASGVSGESDETTTTATTGGLSNTSLIPSRITDTEVRLKITGDLPLWYNQDKPRSQKYTKHMLHLFFTGVCALVTKTHVYFLKIQEAEQGETKKHIRVHFSQILFVKLEAKGSKKQPDPEYDPNVTFYSHDGGDAMIKTGNKGETHVLVDHFALQRKQPSCCACSDPTVPCKCLVDARRLILEDPSAYQQFTGATTGCC